MAVEMSNFTILCIAVAKPGMSPSILVSTNKDDLEAQVYDWITPLWPVVYGDSPLPEHKSIAIQQFFAKGGYTLSAPVVSSLKMPDFEKLLTRAFGAINNVGGLVGSQIEVGSQRWEADEPDDDEWADAADVLDKVGRDLGAVLHKEYIPIIGGSTDE